MFKRITNDRDRSFVYILNKVDDCAPVFFKIISECIEKCKIVREVPLVERKRRKWITQGNEKTINRKKI